MTHPKKASDSPLVSIRHRASQGTIRHNDRIDRFWKNKETGTTVQVTSYYIDVHESTKWVNYLDPDVGRNLSLKLSEFKERFESCGNRSDKF